MIVCLRQAQKGREQNKDLFVVFVDFIQSFDTLSRSVLWKVLSTLGVPENIIIYFHERMKAFVRLESEQSDSFFLSNGTKQGFVLGSLPFSLFFSAVLLKAFSDLSEGFNV